MKTRIDGCIIGVLVAGLLLGSSVSSAETVRWTGDEGEIATNIINLDAGAATLDVDFVYLPAHAVYN